MMQSQNRKKRQRGKRKEKPDRGLEKALEMKIKETRLGSYVELYISIVLRILLGQSLKISVIVTTTRNNKKQVEISMWNSIASYIYTKLIPNV